MSDSMNMEGLEDLLMDEDKLKKPKITLGSFSQGLSNADQKKQLASQLTQASGVEVKPKDVTKQNFDKVAEEAQVKPLEQKQVEASQKKSMSGEDKLFLALGAALPTLLGAAFGGAEGGALGGQIGAQTATTIGGIIGERDKAEREAQEKAAALAKAEAKEQREIGWKERELSAKEAETGVKKEERDFARIQGLRKEYEGSPVTKASREVATAFEKVKTAAENPSAAGDLSLIFGYMKMLDPGSTVREGEFANAQNAGGVPTKILAAYNNALKGERLTPDQRKDFVGQAANVYQAQLKQQSALDKGFIAQAGKYNINPQDVLFGGFQGVGQGQQQTIGAEDIAALEWAQNNPDDPRAKKILLINSPQNVAR